ncbi:HlyD family secretion protein [Desulfohalotomaculum tongense]|uniref:efflux RND transporter periplasmic adaptor subunit n=1 Tax=Desulforadius tongensis TaxID=1216062 RepID=UPI001958F2C8|nr:efflux RND transporter periplasmic adaptor subunit [Desulforadius tongensis]MBM7854580.1 HlyD family secretion protein [Desulforadius tongensis]
MEVKCQQEDGKFSRLRQRVKRLPRWLKWTSAVLIAVLAVGAIMSSNDGGTGVMVTTGKVTKRSIKQTVITNGRLESASKQEFFTPVDSTLMELNVEVGDKVKKGEVLGRLDTMELGRQYEEAKAKLAFKEAELADAMAEDDRLNLAAAEAEYEKEKNNLERIQYLYQQGAVTEEELETARMTYARAEAAYRETKIKAEQNAAEKRKASLMAQVDFARQEVAQAEERLDLATFVAEEDGVVLFVGAEKGNRVLEGKRILVVGSDKKLEVTARVNEMDAGNLAVGQPVEITCSALPGKKFKGEVTRVAAVAVSGDNNGSISVPVTVRLQGSVEGLKPGYTVDMNIITMEAKDLLTVPFEALVTKNGEQVAYVVENGVAKERKVKTQKGNELYDIVLSGLKENDEVILNPPPDLTDGQKVMIGEQL